MQRFPSARFAIAALAALSVAACSDDNPKDEGDTITLVDGGCEPGAIVSCPEEKGAVAEICTDDGKAKTLVACNDIMPPDPLGHDYACFNNECVPYDPAVVCLKGEVKDCKDFVTANMCNASQTGFQPQLCKGPDGDNSACIDGACTYCVPGAKKCQDDKTVLQCKQDGSGYEVYEDCIATDPSTVCTGQQCEKLCSINEKNNSYIGCEYFAADLDNAFVPGGSDGFFDAAGAQYAVVVANPPDSPRASIVDIYQMEGGQKELVLFDSFGEPFPTEPLQPGELRTYKLPRRDVNGTTLAPLAYQIDATVPIIAYQFNPLTDEGVFSNDASLLLPATLVGTDYYVMTREQSFPTLRGFVTVIAVMPGETEVSVTVSTSTQSGKAYEGSPQQYDIPHMEPGTTKNFRLQQFDILNIETDGQDTTDLTGTRVIANQKVAVFGGSEAANAPNTARCVDIDPVTKEGVCMWDHTTPCRSVNECVNAGFNTCCADHLEQQMFPLVTWGSRFVATKSWDRGMESDIFRIMASEDNTTVALLPPQSGVTVPVLNRGEYFEFESRNNFEIVSQPDKPLMVGHFLAAQDAPDPTPGPGDAGTGDPAFMLAVPVEQYRKDYVILVPAEYAENYFNLTVPTNSVVEVDGEAIAPEYFDLVGSGEYSVYKQPLEPGTHTILSSEPAGLIVYGWDQYVSYAYTGGLDLADRSKPPTP